MDTYKPPGWQDLCQLPLRAIVAYAVRHARRVQPLLHSCRRLYDPQLQVIEYSLEAVECFCRAEPFFGVDFVVADQAAREAVTEAADEAVFAAKAAAAAFRAVRHAIEASSQSAGEDGNSTADVGTVAEPQALVDAGEIDEDTAEALAAVLAARAARPVETPWDAEEVAHVAHQAATAAESAARAAGSDDDPYNPANDFERLSALSLGEFPALGEPIDPSDRGPLGKLWTGAAPVWCIRQRTLW
jgi:hypothetical protein